MFLLSLLSVISSLCLASSAIARDCGRQEDRGANRVGVYFDPAATSDVIFVDAFQLFDVYMVAFGVQERAASGIDVDGAYGYGGVCMPPAAEVTIVSRRIGDFTGTVPSNAFSCIQPSFSPHFPDRPAYDVCEPVVAVGESSFGQWKLPGTRR